MSISANQNWRFLGFELCPDNSLQWSQSYAQMPTATKLDDDTLLVLYATRDAENRSRIGSMTLSLPDFSLQTQAVQPSLELGKLGAFDDSGVMPSSLIWVAGKLYLYYVGWNRAVDVPYHNSIGLAVSEDNGRTFTRAFQGPIIDRSAVEPYFCGTCCVRRFRNEWICWYMSCNGWKLVGDKPEPYYDIKRAVSADGMFWSRTGLPSLAALSQDEAISRVTIHKSDNVMHLWFSARPVSGYRQECASLSQIGYARSADGKIWDRLSNKVSFQSELESNSAHSYPEVISWNNRLFMLYNGDNFGQQGFRIAELTD
jgi:hypothetical protein